MTADAVRSPRSGLACAFARLACFVMLRDPCLSVACCGHGVATTPGDARAFVRPTVAEQRRRSVACRVRRRDQGSGEVFAALSSNGTAALVILIPAIIGGWVGWGI